MVVNVKQKAQNTYSIHDVIRALKNKESYYTKAGTTGDFSLIHIVIDSERVMDMAGLTERQEQVVFMYWVEDKTLQDIAVALGVSHQAVADSIKQAEKKLNHILTQWGNIQDEY